MEGGTLVDLVNDHKFTKVSLAKKYFVQLLNNIINIQIRQNLFHQLCFCSEFVKVYTHQSFPLYDTTLQTLSTTFIVSNSYYVILYTYVK